MIQTTPPVRLCVIVGGGGHARVVLDALRAAQAAASYVVLDADAGRVGHELDGVPIVGGDERLNEYARRDDAAFVVGVGSAGDSRARRRLFELACAHGLRPLACVHPTAVWSAAATIGDGVQLLAGCIVGPGAVLGANCLVNSGAIVEHDCRVGDHVHVAIGACLAGGVDVGPGAHIGAGAVVIEQTHIGAGAIVGAGAVVLSDVPPNVVAAGVPARVVRAVAKEIPEGAAR
jgi:UDP-perosamine 4-acetyltransferase